MPAFDGRREINMTFDYIPKVNIEDHTTYNIESDSFYRFIDEFNIDSVKWSEPLNISASYFYVYFNQVLHRDLAKVMSGTVN